MSFLDICGCKYKVSFWAAILRGIDWACAAADWVAILPEIDSLVQPLFELPFFWNRLGLWLRVAAAGAAVVLERPFVLASHFFLLNACVDSCLNFEWGQSEVNVAEIKCRVMYICYFWKIGCTRPNVRVQLLGLKFGLQSQIPIVSKYGTLITCWEYSNDRTHSWMTVPIWNYFEWIVVYKTMFKIIGTEYKP